jgi:hypothetical protein
MKVWLLTVLISAGAVLAVVTLRAAAHSLMHGPQPAAAAPLAPADTPAPPAPAPQAPAPAVPPPPPPAAEIRDDPTIAPDKRQSADNNVSLPTDI